MCWPGLCWCLPALPAQPLAQVCPAQTFKLSAFSTLPVVMLLSYMSHSALVTSGHPILQDILDLMYGRAGTTGKLG